MRPGESCRTCVYMVKRADPERDRLWLECHRYAPRPMTDKQGLARGWPQLHETDWCGEYVKAAEPAAR